MPGPRPKPTAKKVLDGTFRKDRAVENEPTPPAEIPPKPSWLKGAAAEAWDELAPMLEAQGLLTKLDAIALTALCQVYSRWKRAERRIERQMVMKAPSGYRQQIPEVSIAAKALDQLRALLAEFGMTPAARTRVSAAERGEEKEGSIEDFMKRRKA